MEPVENRCTSVAKSGLLQFGAACLLIRMWTVSLFDVNRREKHLLKEVIGYKSRLLVYPGLLDGMKGLGQSMRNIAVPRTNR